MQILVDLPGDTSDETSSESSCSPQTPLDADEHFLHAAMNQPIVQTSLYTQNYSLPTESDCIDHLGHATGISYTNGGVSESPLRRDSKLAHQPSSLTRPLGHPTSTNDPAFHPPAEQSSGSISTSPSSNNSAGAYSFAGSQRPSFSSPLSLPNIQHPYSHPQSLSTIPASTFQLPTTFGTGMQTRLSDYNSNGLPSHRGLTTANNPVSPTGVSSIRSRYENLPGHGKYYPAATSGCHNDLYPSRYLYTNGDSTRNLPANMNMPTTTNGYSSASPDQGSPPFNDQTNFYDIYGGSSANELIKPNIEAKIEKGFFVSGDNCWTCYRRNYFAVQCSYTLTPHLSNQAHVLSYNGEQKQIQAMAMSLSARVDGSAGKNIELVQHTPKRDKGPQNAIRVTKLCPTPPGAKLGHLPHAEPHAYAHHGLMGYGASNGHMAAPYFPLQSQADPEAAQPDPSNPHNSIAATPTGHQHTFERIQFKSATANNGKRRAQQQYYYLIVELWADIRAPNAPNAKWVKVAERASSQVVVRGRSPSHYSNEGPTSASSRGGGAGAAGGGSYHLGGIGGYGGMTMGSALSRPLGNYGLSGGYRGNTYSIEPTPLSSHTVSSASSVAGGQMDNYGIDQSSPMILTSQSESDRMDYMHVPTSTNVGLGLPPIFGSTLPKPKEESYYMPTRNPAVDVVSARTYGDTVVY